MRITFLLSFFILMGTAFAQNLPSVIPPSPEVGKIANAYNFSASMYLPCTHKLFVVLK